VTKQEGDASAKIAALPIGKQNSRVNRAALVFTRVWRRERDSNSLKNSFNNIENTAASRKAVEDSGKQC
jgi:hypothetical protein